MDVNLNRFLPETKPPYCLGKVSVLTKTNKDGPVASRPLEEAVARQGTRTCKQTVWENDKAHIGIPEPFPGGDDLAQELCDSSSL